MKSRLGVCVLVSLTVLWVGSIAQARLWTDNQGKSLNAEFIRVTDGNVILKANGKVNKVPFLNLSEADQEYLRGELEKKGQGNLLPPRRPAGGGLLGDNPLNNAGQNIPPLGGAVPPAGVAGGAVPGAAGGAASGPGFNPRGAFPPPGSGFPPPGAAAPAAGHQQASVPPAGFPPIGAAPAAGHGAGSQPSSLPGMNPAATSSMPPTMPGSSPFPTSSAPAPTSSPMGGMPPMAPPMGGMGSSPIGQVPQYREVYACSKCGKEVNGNIKAGDKCPHCGVRFDYVENSDGSRTYAPAAKITGIGTVIGLVIWGIAALVKKARG